MPEGRGTAVNVKPVIYSDTSIAFTVPGNAPPYFRVQVTTAEGKSTSAEVTLFGFLSVSQAELTRRISQVYSVGVPILPPEVVSFSSPKGNVGCYLYVAGSNYYVGSTAVSIGGIPVAPVVYNSESIGITVPDSLNCTSTPVRISVGTPNGWTASTATFQVGCGPASRTFCSQG